MSLRHTMLARRIIGRPFDWAKRSLSGRAAFKLPLQFLGSPLFKRISAAARDQPCNREQKRHALHPHILERVRGIAIEDGGNAISDMLKKIHYCYGCRFP